MTRLKDRTLGNAYRRRVAREGHTLLEAVDQAKIQQIQAALDALSGITPDGARIFDQAIATAKQDLGKYLQGGLKQSFKNVFSDPVAKATTLANSIRSGLAQLPAIAKLYLPKGSENETQRSIWEMVPPEKQKDLLATFSKAFKAKIADARLGDLLAGRGLPYVDNLAAAVQELLQNTNPQAGFKLGPQAAAQKEPAPEAATANAAPGQAAAPDDATASQAAPAAGQPVSGQTGQQPAGVPGTPQQAATPKPSNDVRSQGAQAAQTSKPAQPTQQSEPGQKPVTTGVPRKLTVQDTDQMNDIVDFLTNPKRKNSPKIAVDPQSVNQVLAALAKNGMLFA